MAGGDVDGDGYGDVVVGRGVGGPARVSVFSGRLLTLGQPQSALQGSFIVPGGNGVYVAVADVDRDGDADLVVGFDNKPTVSIYDGPEGTLISTKNLGPAFKGGVRVAARAGQILVASGPGTSPTVQLFAYADGAANPWTLRSNLTNEKIRGFTAANKRGVFVG
ncbi:MAG: VCBS repeat-containing protein [Planctomycetia bacterium]|nr:VCBS repeat-containing protein [Planctomycetia bacterium]